MVNVSINSVSYSLQEGLTVIQACDLVGVEIPRFCYHERLSIAGNCRMCLVEIEGMPPKPVAACAMEISEGMKVKTNSVMVRKAREGVMEFLLINHPLDCPVCDQGGECDLQDQAMKYGKGKKRFIENKRAIREKNFGPLIKTEMTRCIHCTRCIRFLSDVAGSYELGAFHRGEKMEVDTFSNGYVKSKLSGNIIDLCPVGALTSKPYAFKARPWELARHETIDVMDAVGSSIRVDTRGNEVMRVLPVLNEDVNEEWISDITRFSYDGLKHERLDRPYVRSEDGILVEASWHQAIGEIAAKISQSRPGKIGAMAGALSDCESMFLLKEMMNKLGTNNLECREDSSAFDKDNRTSYLFNTGIKNIDRADLCIIVGLDLMNESPIIGARIRKAFVQRNLKIAYIGEKLDMNFKFEYLGNTPRTLKRIIDEEDPFCNELKRADYPMIILGQDVLARSDARGILSLCYRLSEKFGLISNEWNGFNVLQRFSSRVGGLDMGFYNDNFVQDLDFLYLHGTDEINSKITSKFTVYHGHHGGDFLKKVDIIIPGAAYTEKDATYANVEGRYQRAFRTVFPPGKAREDWITINKIARSIGLDFEYESLADLREEMEKRLGYFGKNNFIRRATYNGNNIEDLADLDNVFTSSKQCFYRSNLVCKSSKVMQDCVEEFEGGF